MKASKEREETRWMIKGKETLPGVKKQDLPIQSTATNDTDTVVTSSTVKKNRSFEKIIGTVLL